MPGVLALRQASCVMAAHCQQMFTAFCAFKCRAKRTPCTPQSIYPLFVSTALVLQHARSTAWAQELVLALRANGLATVIITNGHPEIQVPSCLRNAHVPWPCSALETLNL